jgi:starvation-inducible DNA-binding protein
MESAMPKNNRVVKMSKAVSEREFQTRINLPQENREQLTELLNARLADSLDLYTQTKFAHWNVKGKDFYQVHLLFDAIAEHVEDGVDLIAERITALGGIAQGTLRQAAGMSSLPEFDVQGNDSMDYVRALADRVGAVANSVREAIDQSDELEDTGTADLFTEIVRTLDKDLYFLEAHLRA